MARVKHYNPNTNEWEYSDVSYGEKGKSAYEYAKEGGYSGTEEEFAEMFTREIPTKVSQLTNDKGYLTSVPSEYITETELNSKGYLTQHQSLSGYAKTSDIPTKLAELTDDSTHRVVTDAEKSTWNTKSNFSGDYADLSGKPTIPTVPTKVSAFENDKNYLTSIPSEYVTETELNNKKYLTSFTETDPTVPSWAKASTKPSYTTEEITVDFNNVQDPIENITSSGTLTTLLAGIDSTISYIDTKLLTIPTKTSQLTNDSKFLTSVPSEYITETELNSKNYLTSVPSEYVTETELTNKGYAVKSSAETWTFTLKSGSTVTKKVVLG